MSEVRQELGEGEEEGGGGVEKGVLGWLGRCGAVVRWGVGER